VVDAYADARDLRPDGGSLADLYGRKLFILDRLFTSPGGVWCLFDPLFVIARA
jgi:hypothetical protein